jgi:hypothetical protein
MNVAPVLFQMEEKRYVTFIFQNTNLEIQSFGIINGGNVLEGLAIDLATVFEDIG